MIDKFTMINCVMKNLFDSYVYTKQIEKFGAQITVLSTKLAKATGKSLNMTENTIVIIRPLSTLELIDSISTGEEYKRELGQLIQNLTQLEPRNFLIQEDRNPLSGEPDYQHVSITLPSKEYVDRIYQAQPLFGCLIVHKISHVQICPFRRYSANQCLMCSSKKNPSCIRDMCADCCRGQKHGILYCKCPSETNLDADYKKKLSSFPFERDKDRNFEGNTKSNSRCDAHPSCPNELDKRCSNNMCAICCPIQGIRSKCLVHDKSIYCRALESLNPKHLSRKILQTVAEMHLKVRHELKQGRYDWFRPFYGTPYQSEMIKANRELQSMIDNGSIIRGGGKHKNAKTGKILTFQGNQPIFIQITPCEKIYESVNSKGLPFIEYEYTETSNSTRDRIDWVKNVSSHYRICCKEDYEQQMNAPNRRIATSFHLLLIGLDTVTFDVREMYNEIYSKLRASVGEIDKNNIMILDRESILMTIFNSCGTFQMSKKLEENLNRLGRVACIKFNHPADAIALLVQAVKVLLPLNNGTVGEPIVYPSTYLLKFIESYNPATFQSEYRTLGKYFVKDLKELDTYYTQVRSLEMVHKEPDHAYKRKKSRGRASKHKRGFNTRKKVKKQF